MNTFAAFGMGLATAGNEQMVFDWNKAAELIVKSKTKNASAGLAGDFEWTGGEIFTNGKINRGDYTFLSSSWAKPQIVINGKYIDCYKMQSEVKRWGSGTKWPRSAVRIIKENALTNG